MKWLPVAFLAVTWPTWFTVGLVAVILFIAPIIGYATQPWYPWWVSGGQGTTTVPPVSIAPGPDPTPGPGPVLGPAPGPGPSESLLMQFIAPWMGVPYVFGGCSMRGVDCSCFTQNVMARVGVSVPRTAQTQWNATARVTEPQFGDLVFFQNTYDSPDTVTHVGFYIGGNQMISAAQPAVGRQSLDSPYWRAHRPGFGRRRSPPPTPPNPAQGGRQSPRPISVGTTNVVWWPGNSLISGPRRHLRGLMLALTLKPKA